MRELKVLIGAALLAVTGAAHAQSEFDYFYSGTTLTYPSCPAYPGGLCPRDDPSGAPHIDPWAGTISFITSSSANGTCRRHRELPGRASRISDKLAYCTAYLRLRRCIHT